MRTYHSEADKVRDLPQVMQYIIGSIIDFGCGDSKITPDAKGVDGRPLPGVDYVTDNPLILDFIGEKFDTVFSSHFLEHLSDQYSAIECWGDALNIGGHLVLYLPDGDHYDNKENLEHMVDIKYDPFIFWIKRAFCGEGKDFRGDHLPKVFDLVDSGMDLREGCYSFYVILRKV
ncbi:MAG TPA: methyltransferase domain-containing protein [Cyclobacteriaceae bacterium]|jgi:SAM-dependent methyltransferase|nr:methyltransferase domain-containing protein [Cyclobacteriaceae bacterium]